MKQDKIYGISELAENFDLTLRTIRFYEDEGMLSPSREGQKRIYNHRDYSRLSLICRGKRLGFSIAEIKEFLALYDPQTGQKKQLDFVLDKAREHIIQLEQKFKDVKQTLAELKKVEADIITYKNKTDK